MISVLWTLDVLRSVGSASGRPIHTVATAASGLDAMVVIRYLDVGFKFCLVGSLLSIVPRQRINRWRWLSDPWCRRTPGSSAYLCVCRQQRESGQVHQI